MPLIEYRGHTPVVSVPLFQLAEVEHGVPREVPEHVAAALTLDGASPDWHRLTDDEAAAWLAAQAAAEESAGGPAGDETPEG